MCNCSNTTPCNSCQNNQSCGCPPDYSVPLLPVTPCECCPPGYYPLGNGYCCQDGSTCNVALPTNTRAIPCTQCEDSITTDCVFVSKDIDCLGFKEGITMTQVIEFLCEPAFTEVLLSNISNTQRLLNIFCNIVAACGTTPGVSTPVIGPIDWTIP